MNRLKMSLAEAIGKPKRTDNTPIGVTAANKEVFNENDQILKDTWYDLNRRCFNPRCGYYHNYGGRGIKVYDDWNWYNVDGFKNFKDYVLSTIGYRPEGEYKLTKTTKYSIDRIDSNRHYEPGNIRWATASQQRRNQIGVITATSNKYVPFDGVNEYDSEYEAIHAIGYDLYAKVNPELVSNTNKLLDVLRGYTPDMGDVNEYVKLHNSRVYRYPITGGKPETFDGIEQVPNISKHAIEYFNQAISENPTTSVIIETEDIDKPISYIYTYQLIPVLNTA